MKIKFRDIHLSPTNQERLQQINSIIVEYQGQGYRLTLRQLYYQLVSRDIIPNQQKEYSKLSTLLKEGRMAGIVDWDAIEDRLRQPSVPASWESPEDILDAVASQFKLPRMKGQENYVEVWVEKDALSGVLKRVTEKYHIPILVNRGYSSASAMFDAYERFKEALGNEQKCTILYLGDFDPSGIDMIRDIRDRVQEFFLGNDDFIEEYDEQLMDRDYQTDVIVWLQDQDVDTDTMNDKEIRIEGFTYYFNSKFQILPIALTRQQITQYNPPPNPAKHSDPRAVKFISEHGGTSWEVDALKPELLHNILESNIKKLIDLSKYAKIMEREKLGRKKLAGLKKYL